MRVRERYHGPIYTSSFFFFLTIPRFRAPQPPFVIAHPFVFRAPIRICFNSNLLQTSGKDRGHESPCYFKEMRNKICADLKKFEQVQHWPIGSGLGLDLMRIDSQRSWDYS